MTYYCKECGDEFSDFNDMTRSNCRATGWVGQHVPYEGHETGPFHCKKCGDEFPSLRDMMNGNCRATGWQEKHEPL